MSQDTPHTIEEAVKFVKEKCKCSFDSTIEAHFNLNTDPTKQEQNIRFPITLPHGTGKAKKIAVFASSKIKDVDLELSEDDIDKIIKGEIKPKVDFEVLISEPGYMPKLAKAAKILGPAGVMPSPKSGTVTDNVQKAVEQVKKGKMEVKTESNGNVIHAVIGKKSFDDKQLIENFEEIHKAIMQNQPVKLKANLIKSCFLSATMSPSMQIAIS